MNAQRNPKERYVAEWIVSETITDGWPNQETEQFYCTSLEQAKEVAVREGKKANVHEWAKVTFETWKRYWHDDAEWIGDWEGNWEQILDGDRD